MFTDKAIEGAYKCPLSLKDKENMLHSTERGIATNYTSAARLKASQTNKQKSSWLVCPAFEEEKRIKAGLNEQEKHNLATSANLDHLLGKKSLASHSHSSF